MAQAVIREAKDVATPPAHLVFDYSGSPGKSSKLAQLTGRKGTLAARVLTITTGPATGSQTHEDMLLLAATQDDGSELSEQEIHLMLGLPVRESSGDPTIQESLNLRLDQSQQSELDRFASRNLELFQQEADKLDH